MLKRCVEKMDKENITFFGTFNKGSVKNTYDVQYIDMGNLTRSEIYDNTELNVTLMIIAAMLILLGIVGNCATIVTVRLRNEFHTATFTAVALLAGVDVLAVCVRAVDIVDTFYRMQYLMWIFTSSIYEKMSITEFLEYEF